MQVFPNIDSVIHFVALWSGRAKDSPVMKKPTGRLSFQSAFSLVELLVVIAVIAVIAAIAIPNIAGITQQAAKSSGKRNAQNLASFSSAALAAGYTNGVGSTMTAQITALSNGISVTNNNQVMGPFKVDGLPTDLSKVTNNLTFDSTNGVIRYNPQTN